VQTRERRMSSDVIPIFSSSETISCAIQSRLEQLKTSFENTYGHPPDAIVRAPGRVNLIGEHIDYEGFSVLPMAIEQDILIAISPNQLKKLVISNIDPLSYSTKEFNLDSNIDRLINAFDSHHWTNYILCGFRGYFNWSKRDLHMQPLGIGINMIVYGCVPAACGLSSSSALVVAAAIATAYTYSHIAIDAFTTRQMPTRHEMAELTRYSEYYVGTIGGGMDQAISCLGEDGVARHIEFNPLRSYPVKIPDDVVIVVANSMSVAEKAQDTLRYFNKRVVECMLASKVLALYFEIENWQNVRLIPIYCCVFI